MKVAVVGAGTMGSGIAQLCATAGHYVALVDIDYKQRQRARSPSAQALIDSLSRELSIKGSPSQPYSCESIVDAIAESAQGADFVIEAVLEQIDVKWEVGR